MNYFLVSTISKNGWSSNTNSAESRAVVLKYYFDLNSCILNIIEITEDEFNFMNNRQITVSLDSSNTFTTQ